MSNWTEEYLWDRQEAERKMQEAMRKTKFGQMQQAIYLFCKEICK